MLDTTESKEERSALFLRLWSAKEAIIKGQGGGVFRHVLETQMRLSEGGLLEPVQVAGGGRAVDWQIHELQVEPEVVGMLAVGPEANHPI